MDPSLADQHPSCIVISNPSSIMRDETVYTSLGLPEGSGLMDWMEDPSPQTALLQPASSPAPEPAALSRISSVWQGRGQASMQSSSMRLQVLQPSLGQAAATGTPSQLGGSSKRPAGATLGGLQQSMSLTKKVRFRNEVAEAGPATAGVGSQHHVPRRAA